MIFELLILMGGTVLSVSLFYFAWKRSKISVLGLTGTSVLIGTLGLLIGGLVLYASGMILNRRDDYESRLPFEHLPLLRLISWIWIYVNIFVGAAAVAFLISSFRLQDSWVFYFLLIRSLMGIAWGCLSLREYKEFVKIRGKWGTASIFLEKQEKPVVIVK